MSPLQSLLNPSAADAQMIIIGILLLVIVVVAGQRIYRNLRRHTRRAKRHIAAYAAVVGMSGGSFVNLGGVPEQIAAFVGLGM